MDFAIPDSEPDLLSNDDLDLLIQSHTDAT